MSNTMIIILCMALVTYIPRVVPFVTISERPLPKKIKQFLGFVPYTALGALIIPGVFSAVEGELLISLCGIGFAFVFSWKKNSMVLAVVGSISVVYLLLLIK